LHDEEKNYAGIVKQKNGLGFLERGGGNQKEEKTTPEGGKNDELGYAVPKKNAMEKLSGEEKQGQRKFNDKKREKHERGRSRQPSGAAKLLGKARQ